MTKQSSPVADVAVLSAVKAVQVFPQLPPIRRQPLPRRMLRWMMHRRWDLGPVEQLAAAMANRPVVQMITPPPIPLGGFLQGMASAAVI